MKSNSGVGRYPQEQRGVETEIRMQDITSLIDPIESGLSCSSAVNVEIKIAIPSVESIQPRVVQFTCDPGVLIRQEDTYFKCSCGRLKLRIFEENDGELIYYRRPDINGFRASSYVRYSVRDLCELKSILEESNGSVGVVRKERSLHMSGRTRIHLDRVEGLGDFLELEVVLRPNEPHDSGEKEAVEILEELRVGNYEQIGVSYYDLMQANRLGRSTGNWGKGEALEEGSLGLLRQRAPGLKIEFPASAIPDSEKGLD